MQHIFIKLNMYRLSLFAIYTVISAVSAQDGRKFLLAFPPNSGQNANGDCQIIINTNTQAEVSITFHNFTDYISVGIGSYIYDTDCTIRAPPGHSSKAVMVQSNVDISVQVLSDTYGIGDVFLVHPFKNQGAEYILSIPPVPCGLGGPPEIASFFTLAAETDSTQVEVYEPAPWGYTLVETLALNRFGTHTTEFPGTDYTGWKVKSSAPVSVVTGSTCYKVNTGTCSGARNAGYIFVPSTDEAGYQFIIPEIETVVHVGSGTYIRVTSFSQNNLVQLPDQSIQENLNTGEYLEHLVHKWDLQTRVECREPCVVVLYNEVSCWTYGDGGFLMNITPLNYKSSYSQFTALGRMYAYDVQSYVTIVSDTTNILLDEEPVYGFKEITGFAYYEKVVQVDEGRHVVESTDGGKFVAFVYGHTIEYNYGYGSAVVHDASGEEDV